MVVYAFLSETNAKADIPKPNEGKHIAVMKEGPIDAR